MNRVLVLVTLAGCLNVADVFTCKQDADCIGATAGRCEPSGNCSFADTTCGTDGYRYDSSAGPRAGACVLADTVTQATLDFTHAGDDVQSNCAATGALDRSFELTVAATQTVVLETLGVETQIVVYTGGCPPADPSSGVCSDMTCNDQTFGRTAQVLDPGTYCIVTEQTSTASDAGTLDLFTINGQAILPKTTSASETTCTHPTNVAAPSCFTPVGPSFPMLVWKCPPADLQFSATVTPTASLDMGLTLRNATDNTEVAGDCVHTGGNGAPEMIQTTLASPGPYWLMIDGAGGGGTNQCGMFSVTYSLE